MANLSSLRTASKYSALTERFTIIRRFVALLITNSKQVPIVKGDTLSASIAAASIVAKVTRDRMMQAYDEIYPGYDFASNMGYGSAKHIEALKTLGQTPIHRKSFIGNFVHKQ